MTSDAQILERLHLEYLALRNRAEHLVELVAVKKWPALDAERQARRAREMLAAIERFAELAELPMPALRATMALPEMQQREDAA